MTLIDRLRTGTHEQAVGLLRECWEIVKPEPARPDLPPWHSGWQQASSPQWRDWFIDTSNFERLLSIGTPEACVGAAMMLGGDLYHLTRYPNGTGVAAVEYRDRDGPFFISASTPSLALAAAIMVETSNG